MTNNGDVTNKVAASFFDPVTRPSHYIGADGSEAIDILESVYGIAGHLPQAFYYILRAGRKSGVKAAQDLQKARWYLRRVETAWHTLPAGSAPAERTMELTTSISHHLGCRSDATQETLAILHFLVCMQSPEATPREQRQALGLAIDKIDRLIRACPE